MRVSTHAPRVCVYVHKICGYLSSFVAVVSVVEVVMVNYNALWT